MPEQTVRYDHPGDSVPAISKSRIFWGGLILIIGFMSPLLIPLLSHLAIPEQWKVVISGLLLVGVPEVFMLIAVAVMGRSGYAYLKKRLEFLLRRYGPPDRVGITRHRIGLAMFISPMIVGFLSPYVGDLLPLYAERELQIAIAFDFVFVSSLFVLGGDFWDKLRGLFIHGARVKLPEESAKMNNRNS